MRRLIILLAAASLLSACGEEETAVLIPDYDPGGSVASLPPVMAETMRAMEGVYTVQEGAQLFGDEVVLKFAGRGLSLFAGRGAVYCFLDAGARDSSLQIAGYWRRQVSVETGVLRLAIDAAHGGALLQRGQRPRRGEVLIDGSFSGAGRTGWPSGIAYLRSSPARRRETVSDSRAPCGGTQLGPSPGFGKLCRTGSHRRALWCQRCRNRRSDDERRRFRSFITTSR
jgi:hypothetical protein